VQKQTNAAKQFSLSSLSLETAGRASWVRVGAGFKRDKSIIVEQSSRIALTGPHVFVT
jgi:hypothetical protein